MIHTTPSAKTTRSKDEAQLKPPTGLQDYQLVNQERHSHWYIMQKHQGGDEDTRL